VGPRIFSFRGVMSCYRFTCRKIRFSSCPTVMFQIQDCERGVNSLTYSNHHRQPTVLFAACVDCGPFSTSHYFFDHFVFVDSVTVAAGYFDLRTSKKQLVPMSDPACHPSRNCFASKCRESTPSLGVENSTLSHWGVDVAYFCPSDPQDASRAPGHENDQLVQPGSPNLLQVALCCHVLASGLRKNYDYFRMRKKAGQPTIHGMTTSRHGHNGVTSRAVKNSRLNLQSSRFQSPCDPRHHNHPACLHENKDHCMHIFRDHKLHDASHRRGENEELCPCQNCKLNLKLPCSFQENCEIVSNCLYERPLPGYSYKFHCLDPYWSWNVCVCRVNAFQNDRLDLEGTK
jgi:hypothetical protein